jgi:hypothetical protein
VPSNVPAQPLKLWAYELSPFVVVVKEVLSELELPYLQVCLLRERGGAGCQTNAPSVGARMLKKLSPSLSPILENKR